MKNFSLFKCDRCGCLMCLDACDLAEYLDRGTVSCPYCGANSESINLVDNEN